MERLRINETSVAALIELALGTHNALASVTALLTPLANSHGDFDG